jgi:energy-coupling factor transport system substrate-specific component
LGTVSPRLFALIPAAVAINLVIGRVVAELALPVYLDTLGTMLVAILAGLPGGMLVGTISQLLAGMLSGYQWLAFVVIQWLIALLAAAAARSGGFATPWRSGLWGAACGLACGTVSAGISYLLFKGVTAGGVTAIGALFRSLGASLPVAVTAASISTDLIDKTVAFLVVGALLRALPRRILGRFPLAARAVGK